MTQEQESFFNMFKPLFFIMGVLFVIGLACYLYSQTPEAIQASKDQQTELEQSSCQALILKMQGDVPHGFTVGGLDISLDHDIQALKDKGCIKK